MTILPAIAAAAEVSGPVDARCGGETVAAARVAGDAADATPGLLRPATFRPVLPFAATSGAGPTGAALEGVLLPADARPADRTALAAALAALAGRAVVVHGATARLDRRGRIVGAVSVDGHGHLQARLLAAGLVLFDGAESPCATALAAAEAGARRERIGLWSDPARPRAAAAPAVGLPDFAILSGRVKSVGKSGRTTYLNFGDRFAEDLTVRVAERVVAALRGAGTDVDGLAGRRVLVRGWASPRAGIDVALASAAALVPDDDGRDR
ncbi:thermonuclease family protein [Oharaeibacter diazotrophicus]|uniref:thermonuclease family protein n=1 Tax=Oharaeibacter diazotrophicus TaxID=1920512 RepID=UPI001AADCC59|nr:thermonuclease family protein [Oharaeibacter diazotrophicus]